MARASAAAAAETARQIREVAIDLFADKGYAAVSIDEIAEAAGLLYVEDRCLIIEQRRTQISRRSA